MYKIQATNLFKQLGSEQVLKGIDLFMEPGEVLGILGPSGWGKTTLAKCLIGILELTQGSILINEVRVPNLKLMAALAIWLNETPSMKISQACKTSYFGADSRE